MFKKITLALVISILLISSSYANISQILMHKEIPVRYNGTYAVFEGVSVYGEPGEPVLPLYSYTFLLPPAADLNNVSVQVDGLAEEVLTGTFDVGPGALECDSINLLKSPSIPMYTILFRKSLKEWSGVNLSLIFLIWLRVRLSPIPCPGELLSW